MSEKLQKVLAEIGLGSRREMERWIEAGRVSVNGHPAGIGQRVEPEDQVQVDGEDVVQSRAMTPRILLMNKEAGVICTRKDPEGRPSCFDQLPNLRRGRWVSIGRLDINTSGLLLFTNDGVMANRMMHPSAGLDREYAVRVDRELTAAELKLLTQGVQFEDGLLRFTDVRYFNGSENNHWYHAVVMEGKNREVRRLFESQGLRISRLKRVRFGPVILPSELKRGRVMELTESDVASLYGLAELGSSPSTGNSDNKQLKKKNRSASARQTSKSVLIAYPGLPTGRKAGGVKAGERKSGSRKKNPIRRA